MKCTIESLEQTVANLSESDHTKCNQHMFDQFNGAAVVSETFSASDLIADQFQSYNSQLLVKYPVLNFLLQMLFSINYMTKSKSKSTSSQWKTWSSLYNSFILEVVLRSKNAKATFWTPILLALICTYGNVSESVWDVLRRLRIICSQAKIEKWIRLQESNQVADDKVLLFSFDNCDFFRHVANIRSDHRSTMIHVCTQLVAELSDPLDIAIADIWSPIGKTKLVNYLHCDYDFANQIANSSYTCVSHISKQFWLKFAPVEGPSNSKKSNFTILDPLTSCNTATYSAVARVLDCFWIQHMAESERTFTFVSVDQACFARVWGLKKQFPAKYSWVIPVPGEWHWSWHILQGIYKIWGTSVFLPLSRTLNYTTLDVTARNFHFAEDFLQLVTLAVIRLMSELMTTHVNQTPTAILTLYVGNSQVYELIYMLIYYLCPYWVTRSALKSGNHEVINNMWRYWLHLFIATKKTNYTQLTIRFMWCMQSLHPQIVDIYNTNRVFSFSGEDNTGIPYDGVNELVSSQTLAQIHQTQHSNNCSRSTGMLRA